VTEGSLSVCKMRKRGFREFSHADFPNRMTEINDFKCSVCLEYSQISRSHFGSSVNSDRFRPFRPNSTIHLERIFVASLLLTLTRFDH